MRIPRFYCSELVKQDEVMLLPDTVHRHAVQVLRLKVGAELHLFDGAGVEHEAIVTAVEKRSSQVKISKKINNSTESSLNITLLQAISKGERMDYAIQKAVELGVTTIIPVFTERCNVQLNQERLEKRMAHWQGVLISACEQSGRALLPNLKAAISLNDAMQSLPDQTKIVLSPEASATFHDIEQAQALTLLIGPEGGLTDTEINHAVEQGFTSVQFGPRILRTETATVAALSVSQMLWGDLA